MANAIELRNITKRFGQVVANKSISLELHKGEILSLLGENGSGKTTLMNMLSGIYYPDEGQIFVDGKEVEIRSPKDAFDLHIGMIHQHFKLVDVLTATENIILGLEGKGRLDLKTAAKKIREICDAYGFDVDPDQHIYEMSVSQKQTVEIVKVLYRGADILILDEPTAVLTPQETDKLFAVLRNMRDAGKAIVIITHKMHEVEELSDRVAVLRHGQFIGDMPTKNTNAQEMTNMMVGHAVELNIDRPDPVDPKPRIEVKNLTVRSIDGIVKLDDVSFTANSGEILGIVGSSGSGKSTLLRLICGLETPDEGHIYLDGRELTGKRSIADRREMQMIFQDPAASFHPRRTIASSIGDAFWSLMGRGAALDLDTLCLEVGLSPELARRYPRSLSGGQCQRFAIARAIASSPRVLLCDEITSALDVSSQAQILALLSFLRREKNMSMIFVSHDLAVVSTLCDRIIVMHGGKIVEEGETERIISSPQNEYTKELTESVMEL